MRIFEELQGLGYEGSYSSVWRHAQAWKEKRGSTSVAAYVPLSFAPGEAYQFDWSHEIVVLGGVTTTVKVAHVRLCHSRMLFVRAYPRETQEMVFDARFGGHGFAHIFANVIPLMRERGFSQTEITTIMELTPRSLLTFQ